MYTYDILRTLISDQIDTHSSCTCISCYYVILQVNNDKIFIESIKYLSK